MKRYALILFLYTITFKASAQPVDFKSNTTEAQKSGSVIYKYFFGKQDLVIAYTRSSYWSRNTIVYALIVYNDGVWKRGVLSSKNRRNKWSKPKIKLKIVDPARIKPILVYLDSSKFWQINVDSLNINRKTEGDKDVLFTSSDGASYRFEILDRNNFQILEAYNPDYLFEKIPEIISREVFIKCRNFFVSSFNKL